MFRLLGFLVGSATSIAIILLVTGIPKFHLDDPSIRQERIDEAVEKLLAKKQGAEQAARELADNLVQAAVAVQEDLAPGVDEEIEQEQLMEPVADQPSPDPRDDIGQPETEPGPAPPDADVQPLDDMQWYSFWNPFRSQIAANGFVSQLELVTGLDYRVVKVKNGVYEVAFAYNDDDERRRKLSQISAATGLDVPES